MKNILLLSTAFALFFSSCGPEPTPEPEPKSIAGYVYRSSNYSSMGTSYMFGIYFPTDNQYFAVWYDTITKQIVRKGPNVDSLDYTYDHPNLELLGSGDEYTVADDYSLIRKVSNGEVMKKAEYTNPDE